MVLLRRHGQIVAHEELREQVWPGHTFVDFNNNLNAAVARLRDVLGDSAAEVIGVLANTLNSSKTG